MFKKITITEEVLLMSEIVPFQCVEKFCTGVLDKNSDKINLQTGCQMQQATFLICSKCGRCHWPTGQGTKNRPGQKVFVTKDNEVIYKN